MKYYFAASDEDGNCYTLDYFKEQLNELELPEMKLIVAKMVIGEPYFYCAYFMDCFEKNDSTCGKLNCEEYIPRNGKNGRCKDHRNCYEGTDETITIKLNKD